MKLEFVSRTPQNDRLILIFAGWSTGPSLYADACRDGWDTLVAYDFDDFNFPADILDGYSTIYLFAWSMGVYAAARALGDYSGITAAFAINGTLSPVSDDKGIPRDIFLSTADSLSERNLAKFRLRMAGSKSVLAEMENRLDVSPDIGALRSQLYAIADDMAKNDSSDFPGNLVWRRAYIADADRIFPAINQTLAWHTQAKTEIVRLDAPHYVDIACIVRSVIPDCARVGDRFRHALDTYDEAARAQREIAGQLAVMTEKAAAGRRGLKILEIGAGSGLFTRMYADLIRPDSITYIDLYELPRFNAAPCETYIVGDAEKWIASCGERFDLIVSASTIQWFSHQARFFANAARTLAPGGALICSTFLPGNLRELDAVRPSPMLYLSLPRLEDAVRRHFSNVEILSRPIPIEFPNTREALLHLKNTGVGGSAVIKASSTSLARALTPSDGSAVTLTYLPAWIAASDPR